MEIYQNLCSNLELEQSLRKMIPMLDDTVVNFILDRVRAIMIPIIEESPEMYQTFLALLTSPEHKTLKPVAEKLGLAINDLINKDPYFICETLMEYAEKPLPFTIEQDLLERGYAEFITSELSDMLNPIFADHFSTTDPQVLFNGLYRYILSFYHQEGVLELSLKNLDTVEKRTQKEAYREAIYTRFQDDIADIAGIIIRGIKSSSGSDITYGTVDISDNELMAGQILAKTVISCLLP